MGRPKVIRHSDPNLTSEILGTLQASRHQTMLDFIQRLKDSTLKTAFAKDDVLFIKIIKIAHEEFCVSFGWLAERTQYSPTTVGRWSTGEGLPPPLARNPIIAMLVEVMEEGSHYFVNGLPMGIVRRPILPAPTLFVATL